MPDPHAPAPGPAGNGSILAGRGEPDRSPDAAGGEHATMQALQQALVMSYPVPDADVAWRRVLTQHTNRQWDLGVPSSDPQETTPPLALTGNAKQDQPASPTRVLWRSALGVAALAAVIVLGLLGSIRGIVPRPLVPDQARERVNSVQAVSPDDQEVLALDPGHLGGYLGVNWRLSSAWSSVAEVGEPDFTGFLGSTRFVFRGPDEALIIVDVRPVAGDPSSPNAAWAWAKGDALHEQSRLVAGGVSQPASLQGCRDAIHMEGARKADQSSVGGVTLCAVNSSEIVLITTAGEVLGSAGWAASDRIATFVAAELAEASIVPTHRYLGSGSAASGLYQNPQLNAPLVQPLAQGTLLRWTSDAARSPDTESKTPWLEVRTAEGMQGWVPGDLLAPAVEGEVLGSYPISTPVPK